MCKDSKYEYVQIAPASWMLNQHFVTMKINRDKRDYDLYKNNITQQFNTKQKLSCNIIDLLIKLGFNSNLYGTYLYKDIILETINILNNIDINSIEYEELIKELNNPYSQIYFNLSRNELDIGVKTYHEYIENTIKNIDLNKVSEELINEIYNNFSTKLNYGELSLIIASYITNKPIFKPTIEKNYSKENKIILNLKK